MNRLKFVYSVSLQFDSFVSLHRFNLHIIPPDTVYQKIYDMEYSIYPYEYLNDYTDCFGNKVITGGYLRAHDCFSYKISGIAEINRENILPEPYKPIYKYPSAYTRPSRDIEEFCERYNSKGTNAERAENFMHQLYKQLIYSPGITDTGTTAAQAMRMRRGVCQDYAHILIAICRFAGIPARYAAGFMIGEGVTHAWIEVYSDGAWHGLDPTHDRAVDENYICVSYGRDFADCSIEKGIFVGKANQHLSVYLKVTEV